MSLPPSICCVKAPFDRVYKAISIEVVISNPQAYVTRPKGSVGNCKFILVQKELLISFPLVICIV